MNAAQSFASRSFGHASAASRTAHSTVGNDFGTDAGTSAASRTPGRQAASGRSLLRALVALCALVALSGCAGRSWVPSTGSGYSARVETVGRTAPAQAYGTAIRVPEDRMAVSQVREQIDFLTGPGAKGRFAQWLERSEEYLPYALKVFTSRGLPAELAYLPYMESGYSPTATSHAGAAGVWQFMHMTGRRFGLVYDRWEDQRRDPYKAAEAAAAYFTVLYGEFGDWLLALAAYNAGEGTIRRALEASGTSTFFELARRNDDLPDSRRVKDETMTYVPRCLALTCIMADPARYGLPGVRLDRAPRLVRFTVPPSTDYTALRRAMGVNEDSFAALNPALRTDTAPPRRSVHVYVAQSRADAARAYLTGGRATRLASAERTAPARVQAPAQRAAVRQAQARVTVPVRTAPQPARTAVAAYTVRPGDTLYSIARRGGTTVDAIRRANGLTDNTIAVGQRLALAAPAAPAARSTQVVQVAQSAPASQATVYRVRSGDTLYSIARRHGVTHAEIMRANGLADAAIQPGQRLVIVAGD
jgi:membrane-bound lytic murein transglycosylase D